MKVARALVPSYRPAAFAPKAVEVTRSADGTLRLRSPIDLGAFETSVCNYLKHWASVAPDRVYLSQPDENGSWRDMTYAEVWQSVMSIGQALIDLRHEPGESIAILSGNSIEHALVTLAAMSIGMAVAPISPNYSLLPGGLPRLAEIGAILKPGLVFCQDAGRFSRARTIPEFGAARWISVAPAAETVSLSDIMTTPPRDGFADAFASVGLDTIAKILFTSGSTGSPKGVINTQRMLCSCAVMSALVAPPMGVPMQVEWMPWHHTMGGNAAFHSVLKNGGTFCIDDGRPTPELFHKTVAALKSRPPTSLQTVPAGFALLIDALERDEDLCRSFFSQITRVSYGGAALPDGLIDRFQTLAIASVGEMIPVMSGYGTTETAPTISVTHWPSEQAGEIGLPVPGLELKLLPIGDNRYEIRVRGPNVTPGYLGRPDLTALAFDEDGFYRVGDAVSFMNADNVSDGLRFAGRISENFKLTTGTWVLSGELRLALLGATAPALSDIVVAGENRDRIAILAWPNPKVPDGLLSDAANKSDARRLACDESLIAYVREAIERYNTGQGSSGRVAAFRLLDELPSLAAGEITDKAYVNQRAVLARRKALVDELFDDAATASVVAVRTRPQA